MSEEKVTKRGRFSQSELDEVKTLHEKGRKPEFIANKLNRGVENIKKIIEGFSGGGSTSNEKTAKESKETKESKGSKETKETKEAKETKESKDSGSSKKDQESAKPARQSRSSGVGSVEMINHDFWIRKGVMLRVCLPEDLTKAEAESLAAKISNVPFVR